jgi:hypothetical protein
MRRVTFITLIVLFTLLLIAALFQWRAGRGERHFPGPGVSATPTSSATTASPSP